MNTSKPETLLAKSDGDAAMLQIATFASVLRRALESLEADIRWATFRPTKKHRLTEEEHCWTHLNEKEKEKLAQCREALVTEVASSRFQRGKLLSEYKAAFRGSRVWVQALTAIANAEGCHTSTIRRMIENYEAAMTLPETARVALTDQGIDAARMRNRGLVERVADRLQSEPEPDRNRASQIVEEVMRVKPDPIEKPDPDDEFESLSGEEEQIHRIRKAIRGAVASITKGWRLEAVVEALEEEMYMVWGQRERTEIVLSPHRSTISVDGRRLRSDAQEVA
jgi:hypothetical protein